jgi:hypothetical protein
VALEGLGSLWVSEGSLSLEAIIAIIAHSAAQVRTPLAQSLRVTWVLVPFYIF